MVQVFTIFCCGEVCFVPSGVVAVEIVGIVADGIGIVGSEY